VKFLKILGRTARGAVTPAPVPASPAVLDWKVTVEWAGPGTAPGSYPASGSTVFAPSVTRSLMLGLVLSDAARSAAAAGRVTDVRDGEGDAP